MKCIECEKTLTNKIHKLSADVYCSLKCLWKNVKRQVAMSVEKYDKPEDIKDESVYEVQEALFEITKMS